MHSGYSDGTRTTGDLVRMARAAGLAAISLTDHDTVVGVDEITELARTGGIEVIPGVELSTNHEGCDVHLLGYFMDHHDAEFLGSLDSFREERQKRAERIVSRLEELNLPIRMQDVQDWAGQAVLGRPHIARAMVQLGIVPEVEEAFRQYLGPGRPGYVEKYKFRTLDAIRMVQKAGGVAVLAHPGTAKQPGVVEELAASGLDGLEVNHPRNTEEDIGRLREIAREHGLIETGGSDYHGDPDRPGEAAIGERWVSRDTVEALRSRAGGASS